MRRRIGHIFIRRRRIGHIYPLRVKEDGGEGEAEGEGQTKR